VIITNAVLLQVGDYATKRTRNFTLIDSESFWVVGYFEKTKLHGSHLRNPATIGLMGFNARLRGHVLSQRAGSIRPTTHRARSA
jgi:multidrug resistance efflux pump